MAESSRRNKGRSSNRDDYDSSSNSSQSNSDVSNDAFAVLYKRPVNSFANDGSFLEKFRKMQEAAQPPNSSKDGDSTPKTEDSSSRDEPSSTESSTKKRALPFVGRRRGGKVLKTGIVQKPKTEEEEEPAPKDAWARYLAEVRKYREMSCDDEEKTRPLVK
ncbi:telomerase RNA component interacting RNase-like [Ornithodoros turicata]